jgi:hypothetical protein
MMNLLMPAQTAAGTAEAPAHTHADAHREALRALLERIEPAADAARLPVDGVVLARIEDGAGPDSWFARLPSGELVRARVAVSCLVRPLRGDLVQLSAHPAGSWVTAILERAAATQDLSLDFGNASVVLKARDLQLEAGDCLRLQAAHLENRANAVTTAAAERYASISGTDATHAGNTLLHTERHMGLHARSATITAESLLKVDAAQIHMG